MIEFIGPLYNLLQHFTSHYLRMDTLDFWPLCSNWTVSLSLSLMLRPTVSRPVSLGIKHPSEACDQIFFSVRNTEYVWQLRFWFRGAPSLTRGRDCLLYVPLALASAVFLGPSPLGLATIFYRLRFETSLFVASNDSQGHGGRIRPRLHTGTVSLHVNCQLLLASRYIASGGTTQKTSIA
jgi:hypothetical protein